MPRPQNNPDYVCGHCGRKFNPANHSLCPYCTNTKDTEVSANSSQQ